MADLENKGQVSTLLKEYMGTQMSSSNSLVYDKRVFVPYKDERDHLGRLIAPNEVSLIVHGERLD